MTMYVNVVNKNYSQQKVNIKFAVNCGIAPDRVFIILFKTNLVLTTKNRAKKIQFGAFVRYSTACIQYGYSFLFLHTHRWKKTNSEIYR